MGYHTALGSLTAVHGQWCSVYIVTSSCVHRLMMYTAADGQQCAQYTSLLYAHGHHS